MTDKHLSDQLLADYKLHPSLHQGLKDAGFEYATPIQALTLPIALEGKDVAGQAQTGTGKTAAFLLATFQRLIDTRAAEEAIKAAAEKEASSEKTDDESDAEQAKAEEAKEGGEASETPEASAAKAGHKKNQKHHHRKPAGTPIGALILAPTRELAIQIHKDAEVLAKHTGLKLGLAYGGTGYQEQRDTITAGVDVLIGTPGRIIDYFKQKVFHLKDIQVAVMDEADRMFDLGFVDDIRFLLRRMPKADDRLNLLFSATMSFRVEELAYEHMNAPETVEVKAEKVVTRIEESAYYPAQDEKIALLINLLRTAEDRDRSLVFVNTKFEGNKVADWLKANDFKTSILSGDVAQDRREKLLKAFHDGKTDILVATDVAARGLHIPNVSHVYNYDLPQDPEDYVHRSGRTARAGASGHAISLACEKYAYGLMDIEQYIGHALPILPITEKLLTPPENRPVRTPYKRDDSRKSGHGKGGFQGKGGRDQSRNNQPSRSGSHSRQAAPNRSNQNQRDQQPTDDRPEYKEPSQPRREIEFIPAPDQFSPRFGEIPVIG